jgi:hypothetical protein
VVIRVLIATSASISLPQPSLPRRVLQRLPYEARTTELIAKIAAHLRVPRPRTRHPDWMPASDPAREPALERAMPADAVPGSTIPEDSDAEVLLQDGSWTWCRVIGQRRDRHGRWCVGLRWYASPSIGGREGWYLLDRTRIRRPGLRHTEGRPRSLARRLRGGTCMPRPRPRSVRAPSRSALCSSLILTRAVRLPS